jgi:hypothetical protein
MDCVYLCSVAIAAFNDRVRWEGVRNMTLTWANLSHIPKGEPILRLLAGALFDRRGDELYRRDAGGE